MATEQRQIRVSKFLSKVLRHQPELLQLTLAPGGWVDVDALLDGCRSHDFPITRDELEHIVSASDKQRFSFDETGMRIRANQGHSTEVKLALEQVIPPDVLYHGTSERALDTVLRDGLHRMSRHHVHLTADLNTARSVGSRRGRPVVLSVDAAAMQDSGFVFFRSVNGVWLTDNVPPFYLKRL